MGAKMAKKRLLTSAFEDSHACPYGLSAMAGWAMGGGSIYRWLSRVRGWAPELAAQRRAVQRANRERAAARAQGATERDATQP
jgi:hypothetical protein